MKKVLLLLIVSLLPIVMAEVEFSRVFVVNFNYDNGVITYRDRVIKYGYAPDRRIQPVDGYTAEMESIDNEILYSFRFQIPLRLNFDVSDPITKSLSGGILILNETDFALVFPYYDKAKSIIIYNPKRYKVLTVPLIEEQFIQKKSFWLLILALLIVSYIVYRYYRGKSMPAKNL